MATNYQVKQGDCISSIAFEHGFFPDTIWNHPDNAELKEKRQDPNILMPGDVVIVPDKRIKEVSEPTNQVHKFKCKNTPEKFKIQLLMDEGPRANEEYELEIEDLKFSGTTNSEGKLEQSIPPNAKKGKLTLKKDGTVFELRLGNLNPSDEITGAQGRLRNLGFYFGPIDGKLSDELEIAIQEFQFAHDIEPDGELNLSTKDALEQEYGA
ncbi:MAG: peptidoglycan-binding protein [Pyrinomonadaceae bacterium]|nr:peptidoglycan-binding protein [Pyrinomonadaceae bacterium]